MISDLPSSEADQDDLPDSEEANAGEQAPAFGPIITDYWRSIAAYRQFLEVVEAALAGFTEKQIRVLEADSEKIFRPFIETATKDEAEEFGEILKQIAGQVSQPDEASEGKTPPTGGVDSSKTFKIKVSARPAEFLRKLFKKIRSYPSLERHKEILYRGILAGLVGQFEVLLADTAHQFLRRAPKAAGLKEKTITAAELLNFKSLDDAVEAMISDRVDDLLRTSAEEWRKFFASRLRVDLSAAAPDWSVFTEFIQRRHLIVHNAGRISSRYLANTAPDLVRQYFVDPKIGAEATLTRAYIERALTSFEVTGFIFAISAWAKLYKGEVRDRSNLLGEVVYDSMLESHWESVLHLAQWGSKEKSFDESDRITAKVNSWLAMKRLNRWDECVTEVESFDTSALMPVYDYAKTALLERFDDLFELIDANGAAGLDRDAWDEWPLFDGARGLPRFSELRDKYLPARASRNKPEPPIDPLSSGSGRISPDDQPRSV